MARPKLKEPIYRLSLRRGTWFVSWTADGATKRVSLATSDRDQAEARIAVVRSRGYFLKPARPRDDRPGAVYVLTQGANRLVKIGVCAAPAKERLRDLQIGSPVALAVAYEHDMETYLGALLVERAAHRILSGYRQHGEWFDVTVEEARIAIVSAADETSGLQPKLRPVTSYKKTTRERRLSDELVQVIREDERSYAEISRDFKVGVTTVSYIKRGLRRAETLAE